MATHPVGPHQEGKHTAGVHQSTTTHTSGAQRACPLAVPITATRTNQESGNNQMDNLEVLKQFGITSLDDARELSELTDRIVANLEAIGENDNDLEELERQTNIIAANLKAIEEGLIEQGDLDGLAEQTSAIVANLKVIGEEA